MATKLKTKRNHLAKDLFSKKYAQKVFKPKKGKGSYTRKNSKV